MIDTQNSTGNQKTSKSNYVFHFGSEYDITFDMTNETPINTNKKAETIIGNTFSNTQPVQIHSFAKPPQAEISNALISGSNSPSTHYIDIISTETASNLSKTSPIRQPNQPPISLRKIPNSTSSLDNTNTNTSSIYITSSSSRSQIASSRRPKTANAPNVKAKMYVFGFHEEAKYQPHPFVSSHKPKTARNRVKTSRSEQQSQVRHFQKPFKLSKRRTIAFDDNPHFHNIYLGSFEELNRVEKF